jgi:hypothetical protein
VESAKLENCQLKIIQRRRQPVTIDAWSDAEALALALIYDLVAISVNNIVV